jgi:archaellum component FlaC
VAVQTGGSSPWDPLFDLALFLQKMVDMSGNSSRFNNTPTDELMRMSLGHELKGLLLNYALATPQKQELATIEKQYAATKESIIVEVDLLKSQHQEDMSKLTKAHEEELAKAKEEQEAAVKMAKTLQDSLNTKDRRINALAKDNEAALSELAALRQENEAWVSEKENLEENVGLQYDEGFKYALEQVKVLFPDIDHARLGEADAMLKIDGDQLVPYAPVETSPI